MIAKIGATVLFVGDLEKCLTFYRDTLGFPKTFSDDVSHAFQVAGYDFVILQMSAAVEMVGEKAFSPDKAAGHRSMLCAECENIDAVYEALMAKGLKFIKPPVDQPWGRRTAYFADPEGNLWELYQHLS